jgi:signal transduction histidine kinase
MGVRVCLVSQDKELVGLVRETVRAAPEVEFVLEINGLGWQPSPNSLWVWDFVPGMTRFPDGIDPNELRTHLFVLRREDLGALRGLLGVSDLNLLLKPVTHSALQAFLGGYVLASSDPSDSRGPAAPSLSGERDELLQMLMQANLKLQEFHQERNNFLARSIHDFRGPLTAISGYCELLLADELEPLTSGQRKILQRMQQGARRLTRATDSTWQLGFAQNVEPALDLERADIRECIGRALDELSTLRENKRVSVTVELEPPPENLWFEKPRIEQVLVNLLENACKFTPTGGAIQVRGYSYSWDWNGKAATPVSDPQDRRTDCRADNAFRVDIIDSGPAVPGVDAERIFEKHTSYGGGQDRSGAGLGLAICRMILSQHGGRVWAESSAGGTVFSFVLPLLAVNPEVPAG